MSSAEFSLMSQLKLLLLFQGLPSLHVFVGGVGVSAGIIRIGNERVAVIAAIMVVGESNGVLHLLPSEKFSVAVKVSLPP